MRIALIADAFPPLRTSGAIQLRDLSMEFVRQGDEATVLVPSPGLTVPGQVESWNGVRVIRLRSPRTKDIGYGRRTLGELLMPYFMLRNLRRIGLAYERWDGVVWYSPTIFLGPLAGALKKASACRGYLIVRDIFPEWAVNMGLMGRGLPYLFFKTVEHHQYSVADTIGVQSPSNLAYFDRWNRNDRCVEVLQNWLARATDCGCSIRVAETPLAGRKILVYAGNMGVAQGMGVLLDLAERMSHRRDIGFLFVGRGSDAQRLRVDAAERGLDNVLFFDEIDPTEIPGLYAQCHVGLVALDPRHKTHNIPGKFLSYMQSGLPVLASVNSGNDLIRMIEDEQVGSACTSGAATDLGRQAEALVEQIGQDTDIGSRCLQLAQRLFSPESAVQQIRNALNGIRTRPE